MTVSSKSNILKVQKDIEFVGWSRNLLRSSEGGTKISTPSYIFQFILLWLPKGNLRTRQLPVEYNVGESRKAHILKYPLFELLTMIRSPSVEEIHVLYFVFKL